jgi:hypothetical protein
MAEISNNSIERYRASLRAARARIDNRLKRVHDELAVGDGNIYDIDDLRLATLISSRFGRLVGERDELANASESLKLLCEEFELFIKNEI